MPVLLVRERCTTCSKEGKPAALVHQEIWNWLLCQHEKHRIYHRRCRLLTTPRYYDEWTQWGYSNSKVFSRALAFIFTGAFSSPSHFSNFSSASHTMKCAEHFFYTQATLLVLCKPLLDQVAAFITAALSKFTPTLNDNIWIAKQTRASFHWLLQSGNLLYGGFVPVVILVLPYLESISNLNDRRVRWIWQTNRPRVSAPFCCSATPQTPVLGLHLVISVSFPILRAGCPRLSTSTAGSCRTQNHSPRLVQHVLLTGWGAILEALSFPGKEPAHSPHYYSTNMSLLHCKDFPSPMC